MISHFNLQMMILTVTDIENKNTLNFYVIFVVYVHLTKISQKNTRRIRSLDKIFYNNQLILFFKEREAQQLRNFLCPLFQILLIAPY